MHLDGAEKTPIRKSEKFSLQDLYPPHRHASFHLGKDDGVVNPPSDLMDLRSANLDSKNYRCRSYTPLAGEET
jgi:hypothetical protein